MNPIDDDRLARSQVTLRLDRDLLDGLDQVAKVEGIDRTELIRRLLASGLSRQRLEAAVEAYASGRRSLWSAAETAGVDLYEMLDRVAEAGITYSVDPLALDRLRTGGGPPPSGAPADESGSSPAGDADEAAIDRLRARYRPATTRILFVGESSPAGGTHFYRANSNLYRATREALGRALDVADPPQSDAFLSWFQGLGCWLVDLADRPVDREAPVERTRIVDAGVPALASVMRKAQPARVIVVLRRIAPAVRRAAQAAGIDDRTIDVLPFPIRQWRPVYVDQLAGILAAALGAGPATAEVHPDAEARRSEHSIAEPPVAYANTSLHDAMIVVLRRDGGWMKASAIARAIADGDLWRRPSDGLHPAASQISARARSGAYASLFQTSDLGIRLREAFAHNSDHRGTTRTT